MKISCVILIITLIVSCVPDKKPTEESKTQKLRKNYFELISPKSYDTIACNSLVDFEISSIDSLIIVDSVHLFIDGKFLKSYFDIEFSELLSPGQVGRNNLRVSIFFNDSLSQSKTVAPFFLSDLVPQTLEYKLVKTFPHSTDYFTEGLVYKDGLLYEGTGDWGKSGVFISNLETGEVLKSYWLPSDKFGEGISILNGKITQLTYKSQEGYVYDLKSLEKKRTFKYSFYTEGWGITTDKVNYYMSNGTDKIFILDTTYYSLIREMQVCDNKEPVDSLNELEYVNGLIYSNIWMNNKIAQIDSKTGKVHGYLDLTKLIPEKYRNHHSDVLNGIAYLPDNGHLLVTGKKWDKIYEIEVLNRD